jgi:hypothetical protein
MFKQVVGLALCLLGTGSVAAHAGSLIPVVPFPGSTSTDPFDINDKKVIAGEYTDADGNSHAFFGTIDGQYTAFDGDHYAGYTQANGIDEHGLITGIYDNPNLCPDYECGFVREPDGSFFALRRNGVRLQAYPREITSRKKFVGSYLEDSSFTSFRGHNHRFKSRISLDLANAQARGINHSGVIVGRFTNSDGHQSGFIRNGDTVTTIDYPDETAVNTFLFGINDRGIVTGSWDAGSPDFISRGFIYDTNTGTFQALNVPGENLFTFLEGINGVGFIAVRSDAGNFIYCPLKQNCPGGTTEVSFGPPLHALRGRLLKQHTPAAAVQVKRRWDPELARPLHATAGQ